MNINPPEVQRLINHQRLLAQIQENIKETLVQVVNLNESNIKQQLSRNIVGRILLMKTKLKEFQQAHWKLYDEIDERQIYVLIGDLKSKFCSLGTLDTYLKSIELCTRESPILRDIRGREDKWEFFDPIIANSQKRTVHALLMRPKDNRYWYLTIIYDTKTLMTYDIIINLIDSNKELSQLNKINVDDTHCTIRKLNEWIRILYFSQTTLKELIDFRSLLRYISVSIHNMFHLEQKCRKCKEFLRLSPKDGYLMPHILFQQQVMDNTMLYHEDCLFYNE